MTRTGSEERRHADPETAGDHMTHCEGAPSPPTVCIITLCSDLTYLYGALTTLQTIRKGFPTARVLVYDNGSLPEAQLHIKRAAAEADALFLQLVPPFSPPLTHHEILRVLVMDGQRSDTLRDPLVILDGDCLFWESCEAWPVDGLLAGRRIPTRIAVEMETLLLLPRLHTSFLWIPDRRTLRQRILEIRTARPFWDPFTPWMVPHPTGKPLWYFGDTASNLYGAIQKDCTPFTEAQLDCYDHLFAGSTGDIIAHLCAHPNPGGEWFARVHAAAQRGDWASLRGVWREQKAYFVGAANVDLDQMW